MYFVEPSTICTTGRTQEEFDAQGTGYMMAMQNGPTAETLEIAPANYEDALQSVSPQFAFNVRLHCLLHVMSMFYMDN